MDNPPVRDMPSCRSRVLRPTVEIKSIRSHSVKRTVWTPLVVEAARTPTAQVLLGFSRFPAARVEQDAGRSVVQFSDMRFAIPLALEQPPSRRSALFTVTVTFDPGGSIVQERLGD